MAEVVGLVASVVGIIELARTVTSAVFKYGRAYKTASKSVNDLRRELALLVQILEQIKDQLDDDDDDSTSNAEEDSKADLAKANLTATGGPLWLCHETLEEILAGLPKPGTKMSEVKHLMWPFKEKEMKEHVANLERAKSILELSLSVDQSAVLKEIQKLCEETQGQTAQALVALHEMQETQANHKEEEKAREMVEEQNSIIQWLHDKVDFEKNQTAAAARRHEGTCNWFLEGTAFQKWLKGEKCHLWIHGIAGAGKTVLMSSMISTAMDHFASNSENVAICYFYFSFVDSKTKKVDTLLSSILAQLLDHDSVRVSGFPKEIVNWYKDSKSRHSRPVAADLLDQIKAVAKILGNVYIFIDALDECEPDEQVDLLEHIESLCALDNVKTITTSRNEDLIETHMKEFCQCVSMEAEAVDRDVKVFVHSLLEKDSALRRHSVTIKKEIADALVSGAHGMFRWVECQVDSLRRCRTAQQVRSSLKTLPKTLFHTYDRILARTRDEDREYLRRGLCWLVFSERALGLCELAEAMVYDPDCNKFDPENSRLGEISRDHKFEGNFQVVSNVRDICGGLIRIEEHEMPGDPEWARKVSLAHFSVQEYLLSEDLATGALGFYSLRGVDGNDFLLKVCLSYMQIEQFVAPDASEMLELDSFHQRVLKILSNLPLAIYSRRLWKHHVVAPEHEDSLLELAPVLFRDKPEVSPQFSFFSNMKLHLLGDSPDAENQPSAGRRPVYFMAKYGFARTVRQMIARGHSVEREDTEETDPLSIALRKGNKEVVKTIVEVGGISLHYKGDSGLRALQHAQDPELLPYVVERTECANVRNPDGKTLVQCAIIEGDLRLVRVALGKSMDPNGGPERPPLHLAIRAGSYDIVKVLLEAGADVSSTDPSGMDALAVSTQLGRGVDPHEARKIRTLLISYGSKTPRPSPKKLGVLELLLIITASGEYDHTDEIISLVRAGADFNQPTRERVGATPLTAAVRYMGELNHRSPIIYDRMVQIFEAMTATKRVRASMRIPAFPTGTCLLNFASRHGTPDCVKLLLKYAAPINLSLISTESVGIPALKWAAIFSETMIFSLILGETLRSTDLTDEEAELYEDANRGSCEVQRRSRSWSHSKDFRVQAEGVLQECLILGMSQLELVAGMDKTISALADFAENNYFFHGDWNMFRLLWGSVNCSRRDEER